jgi:hypothetical protein
MAVINSSGLFNGGLFRGAAKRSCVTEYFYAECAEGSCHSTTWIGRNAMILGAGRPKQPE